MDGARKTSMSLAGFVVLCFFLPWIELSCLGVRDSASGYDLARAGDDLLWVVPIVMLIVIFVGLSRSLWDKLPMIPSLVMTVGGSISAYVMYREGSSRIDATALVATQWSLFFWLGLLGSLGVVALGFGFYVRRSRSP